MSIDLFASKRNIFDSVLPDIPFLERLNPHSDEFAELVAATS